MINAGQGLSEDGINLLIPFKKAPGLGYKYFKSAKDLEIQYWITSQFVQPMYEQAKVEEVKIFPHVLVLRLCRTSRAESQTERINLPCYFILRFFVCWISNCFFIGRYQ